ncbi:unnamed protein product [Paramecium primaurelia]|uniref:Uncharacterized protein n=1 Tax=Paramecium primaurelia TaxID=5886 RepID=A0A8S1MC72_PARPR|nr:unnamed protein product [Paramecium primaurelia]
MLIYKKATPQELQKYRDDQVNNWKKEKDLQRLSESQVNQMLDLFLLFANQRTFTIRTKDVEAQNTLLRVNEESTLFQNVLSKMILIDEDLNFINFLKLYLQSIHNKRNNQNNYLQHQLQKGQSLQKTQRNQLKSWITIILKRKTQMKL